MIGPDNRLQASILLALKPSGRGLTVVGDDLADESAARSAPRVGTMSWASRAARGAGGRMTPMGQFIKRDEGLIELECEGAAPARGVRRTEPRAEGRGEIMSVPRAVRASSVSSGPRV
jgi:hypothetical protein